MAFLQNLFSISARYTRFSDFGKAEDFANCSKPVTSLSDTVDKNQPRTKIDSNKEAVQIGQGDSISLSTWSSTNTIPEQLDSISECSNSERNNSVQSNSGILNSSNKVSTLSKIPAKRILEKTSTFPCTCVDSPNIAFSLKVNNQIIQARDRSSLHKLNRDDKETIIRILNEGWKVETTFLRRVTSKVSCAVGCSLGDILFALFGKKISLYVKLEINKSKHLQVKLVENMKIKTVIEASDLKRTNCKIASREDLCSCVENPNVAFSLKLHNRMFQAHDKTFLHTLKFVEKVKLLRILADGWIDEDTFRKEITAQVPRVKGFSLEDILFALFGDKLTSFVDISISLENSLTVKLNSSNISIRNVTKRLDKENLLTKPCIDKSEIVFKLKLKDHTLNARDISSLLKLTHNDKIKILEILSKSWKNQKTVERKVAEEIPNAKDFSLGDILFALIGNKISVYVDFRINDNDNLQTMLKEAYNDESRFESILLNARVVK